MATKASKKFPHDDLAAVAKICGVASAESVQIRDGQLWAYDGQKEIPFGTAPQGGPTETPAEPAPGA